MEKVRRFALCADDYAQNDSINEGILYLLKLKALTAVSCFSTSSLWKDNGGLLTLYTEQADFGLHFNLTEGFATDFKPSLKWLLLQSYLRMSSKAKIKKELHKQCDAFEEVLNKAPDFIDGHQHVHQFPVIRKALLEVVQERALMLNNPKFWIRNTALAEPTWKGKAKLLQTLGGTALRKQLNKSQVNSNTGFAGVYGFDREDYDQCFLEWLNGIQDGALIMCHPATRASVENKAWDEIATQRPIEFEFLDSEKFSELLQNHHLELVKLSTLFAPQK